MSRSANETSYPGVKTPPEIDLDTDVRQVPTPSHREQSLRSSGGVATAAMPRPSFLNILLRALSAWNV
jgi:hypothetical protein